MCEAALKAHPAPSAAAQPTLVLRLHLPATGADVPDILAGRQAYDAFAHAAPTLYADAQRAWDGGLSHRTYGGAGRRYDAQFVKADGVGPPVAGAVLCWVTPLPLAPSAQAPVHAPARPTAFGMELGELEGLLELAPAAIAVFRQENGKLIYHRHNSTYASLVGKANLDGMEFGAFSGLVRSDDGPLRRKLLKVLATGRGFRLQEVPVKIQWYGKGDVSTRYFDIVSEPVFGDGQSPVGASLFAYDVSAIVLARRKAEQKEAYFRHLADNLPQIVWSADHDCKIDWFNLQWFRFRGMQAGDARAARISDVSHPDDQARKLKLWAEAREKIAPFSLDMRLKDQSGQYRWFLVQVHPIVDEATQKVRWFGSSTDVHEQKILQHKLEGLLENMDDGFWTVAADRTITRVNKKHALLAGIPKEDQLGRKLRDVFKVNDELESDIFRQSFLKALTERVAICCEEYYAPLAMWMAVSFYPTIDGGVACIYRNLSPKRALQKTIEVEKQKFEAVFVNSPASKALLRGPTLIYEKVNDKYAEAMGHRPLLGKRIDEAAPELVSLGVVDAIRNVYHTGEPFVGKAMPTDVLNPKTGQVERHYCDATYSRIADNAGRPYGVYVHAIDITDQVVASRRADELAVSLREAIVSRDAFLSSASHELKTPVTSIKMQLQMTRRHVKPELGKVPDAHKLAKTLDVCGKQVDRLGALVDDLLDVSRIAAGKMTFNFAPVDIGELTRESLQQFGDQIDQACCPLTVDIQAPLMVVCDGFRIEQVIVNLITNAIKYGSCSPITVKAHRREDGGVRISVADRGMGICPNNQSKIFDRFERAIPHGNVSGMGLGLFICRQIIEAHGGQIAVSSELGQGSVFTVDLPADPGT